MPRTKKVEKLDDFKVEVEIEKTEEIKLVNEESITDIIEIFYKDENRIQKIKKSYMNGDRLVKEEILNA